MRVDYHVFENVLWKMILRIMNHPVHDNDIASQVPQHQIFRFVYVCY